MNPGVTAPIIGARTVAQLDDNLDALGVGFTEEQLAALDVASAIEPGFPHVLLSRPRSRDFVTAGTAIEQPHTNFTSGGR